MAGGRKRGGQPGNLNALKHGFYSKQFQKGEMLDLEGAGNLKEEIGMMRVVDAKPFDNTQNVVGGFGGRVPRFALNKPYATLRTGPQSTGTGFGGGGNRPIACAQDKRLPLPCDF